MHQPLNWWKGLLPVALVWVAGSWTRTAPIEADLLNRGKEALAKASPDTASALKVSVAGRDIMLDGPEFGAGQGAKIAQAVADSSGVRLVSAAFTPVPAAKPFVFSAAKSGDQFTLSGAAPLPAIRDKLLDAAKAAAPGAQIIDKLTYATGAPDGFDAIAARGVADTARLDNSSFSLADKAYSISGAAASSAVYEAAIASTQQLPAGAALAKADIAPPEAKPYSWSVTSDGVAATIAGVAPSIEARSAIARAAATSLPGKMIVDQMQIARGAPAGDFTASAAYALTELGRLQKGRVSMTDGAYSIVGEAATSQAYDAATNAAKQLPAGLTLARADILAPEVSPFVWSAASDGTKVTVSGMAPTGIARDAIAEAAAKALPGKTIVNDMGIARGAPAGDFAGMAGFALAELGQLSKGGVSLSDSALSISGEAVNSKAYDTAMAAAKQLPAGVTLARADITPPEVKPFTWGARGEGDTVTLTGYVPDAATRDAIAAAAAKQFPTRKIVNEMGIARGAPAGNFSAMAAAAIGELGKLSSGQLSLSDRQLSLSGQAPADLAADKLAASARGSLPAPFTIGALDIKDTVISPYVFKVAKSDGKVVLSGYAPDEKSKQELIASAKSAFFNDAVSDDLKIGKGAPANFLNAAKAGLPAMARAASGSLTLSDGGAKVEASAIYAKAADQIKFALEGAMPPGFKLDSASIGVAPAGPPIAATDCQALFTGLLSKSKILFETGSSNLSKESAALLDLLVGLSARCADANVEVAGHTDSVGAAVSNLDLSRRRAEAVVAYLKDAGLDVSHFTADGYGETKPIASNDTADGRAQNRRIEFIVK